MCIYTVFAGKKHGIASPSPVVWITGENRELSRKKRLPLIMSKQWRILIFVGRSVLVVGVVMTVSSIFVGRSGSLNNFIYTHK